jgi:hypothetical protein
MNVNYLLPNKYKKVGWMVFIPSAIIGIITVIFELEPEWLDVRVPSISIDEFLGEKEVFGMVKTNFMNEICGVLVIISSLIVGFSKERQEDEYISKIRMESLVWAVYVNYGILLISFLFIYDFAFYWIMVFNMFTVLVFFIIRLQWQISKTKKSLDYEE